MLPRLAGHLHSVSPPQGGGLPEQGMEEGRQRKQELEQPAHRVLPQTLRALPLATG